MIEFICGFGRVYKYVWCDVVDDVIMTVFFVINNMQYFSFTPLPLIEGDSSLEFICRLIQNAIGQLRR